MDNETLQARVAEMAGQLEELQAEVTRLRARVDENISEDTLVAISAAVAAYLGCKARIKTVRFGADRSWAQQGRQAVQRRVVPHLR